MRWPQSSTGTIEWSSSADISETDQEYVIRAKLPAVKKALPENVNVDSIGCESKDRILTVHMPNTDTHKTAPIEIKVQ